MHRYLSAILISAATLTAAPAFGQFGSIFGEPPRPPGAVPTRPAPSRNPWDQPAPWDRNAPPPQTAPRTASPPPVRQSPPAGIQSQPLPPPPGGQQSVLPRPTTARPPAPDQSNPPGPAPLNGLPPGQRQPRGTPGQTPGAATAALPPDEVVVAPPAQKIANPGAIFSGLDKITGRIITFDVAINETVQFGALQVTPRVCYTRPPTETPNTDAFLEVDEITLQGDVRRVFTGWMFASSPGLHAVEHPIYDVWLVDCKGGSAAVAETQAQPAVTPNAAPAPSSRTRR